ncbi:MAG: hypothetical protein KC656_33855, partial [Myxococcales bacterium]|nr:hypothetical protein [Myxococcales bacterium]
MVLALSALPSICFPLFRLPIPSGPHPVGTRSLVVPTGRPDPFRPEPRVVALQVWYPAVHGAEGPLAPYVEDPPMLAGLLGLLGLPRFVLGHLDRVPTVAVQNAAPASGAHPAVVFSPGRAGYRQEATGLCTDLASHGFVVVAVDSPSTSSGVRLPDGVVGLDPRMVDASFVDRVVPIVAADLSDVRRQLPAIRGVGVVDTARVGVLGISLGGEAAAEACLDDPAFAACAVLDLWVSDRVARAGLRRPVLLLARDAETMRREGWAEEAVQRTLRTLDAVQHRSAAPVWAVTRTGLFHADFGDAASISPLVRLLGISGVSSPEVAHEEVVPCVRA